MFNHDHDEDLYEDDEKFYRETVYNEDYYIEEEQEMIRQSDLELELEKLEDVNIDEMEKKGYSGQTSLILDNKHVDNLPVS